MKIWFRVGMEADITVEELKKLKDGDEGLMKKVINRADLSGETYILGKNNGGADDYDNPDDEISFLFDCDTEPDWLNEKEKQLIDILEDAKKYCKGELELDLNDEGIWMAWDYREDLGGAFPIETKGFNERIISISEAENRGIDVRRCCDECGISYVG